MTSPAPWPRALPLSAAVTLYLGVTGLLLRLGLARTGGVFVYAQDDPYIHLTIARTLAEHGVWGIRPTEFASASSSPLWTVLLAGLWTLGAHAVWLPLVLNVCAGVGLLAFVDVVLRPTVRDAQRLGALAAVIFITPLPTLAIIGMEHTLQVGLALALVWTMSRVLDEPGSGRVPMMCFLAMALAATRYEGLLLAATVSCVLAAHRRLGAGVAVSAAALLPAIVFGAYSMAHGGLPLPNSVLMKSGPSRFSTLGSSISAVASDWFAILNIFGRPPELAITCVVLLALTLSWRATDPRSRLPRFFAIAFVGAMAFHVCLVKLEWFFRYEAYLMALGTMSVILFAADESSRTAMLAPFRRTPPGTALVVLLCLPLGVRTLSALATTPPAMRNVYEQQYQMGLFFRGAYPADTIAVNDIGAVGWMSSSPIVDVVGLANDSVANLKRQGSLDAAALRSLIASRNVKAIAMYEKVFEPILPRDWTLVGEWTIAGNVAVSEETVGFFAASPDDATRLRSALDRFAAGLPRGVTYTRRP